MRKRISQFVHFAKNSHFHKLALQETCENGFHNFAHFTKMENANFPQPSPSWAGAGDSDLPLIWPHPGGPGYPRSSALQGYLTKCSLCCGFFTNVLWTILHPWSQDGGWRLWNSRAPMLRFLEHFASLWLTSCCGFFINLVFVLQRL